MGAAINSFGAYDDIYRLTDEKVTDSVSGNSEISYTYDKTANRLTETKNGSTTKYTYDADDRLLTEGNITYTYDKNGNLLTKVSSDETDSYKYDYENHMVQARIAKGGNTTNEDYTYDANNVRTSKTVNGTDVTSYITDNNTEYAKVLEEKDNDGKVKAAYAYGDDLISQVRNGKTSYYVYDGEMSVRQLTDEAGKVTDTYTYDAFGNLTNKTGSTENDFLYTGQQYDANTGLYNLRARYYNPANGRFTSVDTYAGDEFDPLTLHKYLYCSADPVNHYDPSGNLLLAFTISSVADEAIVDEGENVYNSWVLSTLSRLMSGKIPQILFACETYNKIFSTGEALIDAETFATDFIDITQAMDYAKSKSAEDKTSNSKIKTPDSDSKDFTKQRGNQGWKDKQGNTWKKDKLHKDHWDISNSKGKKIREVDYDGNEIWPNGPKNNNKKP